MSGSGVGRCLRDQESEPHVQCGRELSFEVTDQMPILVASLGPMLQEPRSLTVTARAPAALSVAAIVAHRAPRCLAARPASVQGIALDDNHRAAKTGSGACRVGELGPPDGHLRDVHAPGDRLPYKADIEFLARIGAAGLDDDATLFAATLFERVRRVSPTGAVEYRRIAAGRATAPEIIGYDISLSIRAALAVGERLYATQLADAAIQNGKLQLTDAGDSYQVTSAGALVSAIAALERPGDGQILRRVAVSLVRAQSVIGSWAANNTQATAYSVLGLASVPRVTGAPAAVARGKQWLLDNQLESGAWAAYHDGLPEPFVGPIIPLAEAEALAALMTVD